MQAAGGKRATPSRSLPPPATNGACAAPPAPHTVAPRYACCRMERPPSSGLPFPPRPPERAIFTPSGTPARTSPSPRPSWRPVAQYVGAHASRLFVVPPC